MGRTLPGWNDHHIRSLASGLPNLKRLCLVSKNLEATADSLIALGERCPSLEYCRIPELEFDILDLQPVQVPLFPKMKELTTGPFVIERGLDEAPEKHALIFVSHFPEVFSLGVYETTVDPDKWEFTASVHEILSDIRMAKGRLDRLS
ncbi:hypothetical protein BDW74DRAFT_100166 [Aspergillus multicolor]|uniref:uncharacterized protein n=1 Tax=Aspergillus multicolor TaxID=41759 RepID=UPI003CCCD344